MYKIKRLNEELSRWAFEISLENNENWIIAFTNPTAGPWKTIKANSLKSDKNGEVYRFALEEKRPDIVLYNDLLKVIIIIEAKDNIKKLLDDDQAKKSVDVVKDLALILHGKGDNQYWAGRENYKVIVGLLWGAEDNATTQNEKKELYDTYHDLALKARMECPDIIIGIETIKINDSLECTISYEIYNKIEKEIADKIVKSLN